MSSEAPTFVLSARIDKVLLDSSEHEGVVEKMFRVKSSMKPLHFADVVKRRMHFISDAELTIETGDGMSLWKSLRKHENVPFQTISDKIMHEYRLENTPWIAVFTPKTAPVRRRRELSEKQLQLVSDLRDVEKAIENVTQLIEEAESALTFLR